MLPHKTDPFSECKQFSGHAKLLPGSWVTAAEHADPLRTHVLSIRAETLPEALDPGLQKTSVAAGYLPLQITWILDNLNI